MTTKEMFEKVNLVVAIEQRRFFNHLADTISELEATYGDFVVAREPEKATPRLEDKFVIASANVVLPLYHNAIVDNIVFLETKEEAYKSEFIRKAQDAYLKYWNSNAKGKRVKRTGW